jgi:hypothetical protein
MFNHGAFDLALNRDFTGKRGDFLAMNPAGLMSPGNVSATGRADHLEHRSVTTRRPERIDPHSVASRIKREEGIEVIDFGVKDPGQVGGPQNDIAFDVTKSLQKFVFGQPENPDRKKFVPGVSSGIEIVGPVQFGLDKVFEFKQGIHLWAAKAVAVVK